MSNTPEQIATITNGQLRGTAAPKEIKFISTDSRKISFPEHTAFFALISYSGNGHHYLEQVYDQGVRTLVICQPVNESAFPDALIISVDNTLFALQALAGWHRQQFPQLKVIGITGSNGKTILL